MLVPTQIRRAYFKNSLLVSATAERVRELLKPFCADRTYIFLDRIKSLQSVAEKIESGRFRSWTEIDDLYACTIVVPLASYEPQVLSYLKKTFITVKVQPKNEPKPPDAFRFDSTRFHGKLMPPQFLESNPDESVYSIVFEVQIKSVLDFAWSQTTHALVYKADTIDWRRLRLAAQLKAVVEQLDMLFTGFDKNADSITDCTWPAVSDKAEIHQIFKDYVAKKFIPSEMTPKDWSRFSENVYRALQAFSGKQPDGQEDRSLRKEIDDLRISFDGYLQSTPLEQFPRSLSLFQVVIGVLGTQPEFSGRYEEYAVPMGTEAQQLFPGFRSPGSEFQTES